MSDPAQARPSDAVTAAILVIGDEILSGRTKDKNIGYIADYLTNLGIDLEEVRIVPDVEAEIVAALNALRTRYTYVFTTGGIGPTHDDITADSVAKAFGVPIGEDPRAIELLLQRIKPEDLNEARRRMARIPEGASLVQNAVSKAPGFMLGNVIVMAGVPSIMQTMLDDVAPRLRSGAKMIIESIEAAGIPEGAYAAPLGEIAAQNASVSIGSYPSFREGTFHNQIVVRGKDAAAVATAKAAVLEIVERLQAERRVTKP
ncbi:competence/damage-inducible protein A [Lichenihabitans sp. PAMC28606]|uniref:competence/damage-inducible protein A n=1 Tax=Lichenihabitans sp. PAMC28606 TaxID=2880932 RepID=UPI001D0B769B|nr:molybdopterin-binding protein [Lichenihabitans sp. PAMC28606]UDL94690.1 competence/damage-inducible protein A [Lichenihabitans sp. PAMC28606]